MAITTYNPLSIFTAGDADQFTDPPGSWAYVGNTWRGQRPAEFDLEIWDACVLSALRIVGAIVKTPGTPISDDDFEDTDVDTVDDTATITTHAYRTGDGPFTVETDGTLPGGLVAGTQYWLGVVDANTVKFFTSLEAALAGGTVDDGVAVDLLDDGDGTHTLVGADADRLVWLDFGLLGPYNDGALTNTASRGYNTRVKHRDRVLAYALQATYGSGAPNASVSLVTG